MSRRLFLVLLTAVIMGLTAGIPVLAQARVAPTVTKPRLSTMPVAGVPFTASGFVRPAATAESRTVVRVVLSTFSNGRWEKAGTYRARIVAGKSGTAYSRQLTVPADGRYAVRALHYRAGRLVARSTLATFDVARRVTIDSNVNGWLAPDLAETIVPPGTPLDVVFTTPADWAAPLVDGKPLNGAAQFIWGDFEKVDAAGLIWHTDGLEPGRYDWMRDGMPKYGTGVLIVSQQIDIDKVSHEDTHALPYLPADLSFGEVSAAGMGCDRSIAFLTRIFSQTSANPLEWHTDGLVPGSYDWKCWMDDCHYGKLVVDDGTDVAVDSDPHEVLTQLTAGEPVDLVFSGARMMCWRTIHFTGAAGDLTKVTSYSASDPHVTWHTAGLAAGSYEWECWMGPQCHHGTIVVQ
jgi:hypothetical protein